MARKRPQDTATGGVKKRPSQLKMQETRPIDNQEPIPEEAVDTGEVANIEEAVDIDAGITSGGVEIVSDKKPLGNALSFEEMQSLERRHKEEQIQSPKCSDKKPLGNALSFEEMQSLDRRHKEERIQSRKCSDKNPLGNALSLEEMQSLERRHKEEQIQSLKSEVEVRKLRITAFQSKLDDRSQATDPTRECMFAADTQRVADRLKALREIIKEFASAYFGACNGDGSGKQLSESEKRSIIAALDGWCPQESWDSLLEHFSADKYICSQLPSTLAEALLHKHICDYILTNPFWYFGCSTESKPTQTDDFHTPFWNTFGTQMYNLWQSFIQVNAVRAHVWRRETVRLPFVGAGDKQTRESAIEQFASWVLQGPLRLLAEEITDAEKTRERHRALVSLITDAAEFAIKLFCNDAHFILHGLEKSGLYKHIREDKSSLSTTLTAHHSHRLGDEDDRLDDRPPVILIEPALVMGRGANLDVEIPDELIVQPGVAVIEDREAN